MLNKFREWLFKIYLKHFMLAPRGRHNRAMWIRNGKIEFATLPDKDDLLK